MKFSVFILRRLSPPQRDFLHTIRRYLHKKVHPEKQLFIFFVDGSVQHGGMTDRFKGVISTFAFCLHNNIPYRLRYTSPFDISDYLLPNQYDWRLRQNEKISYNFSESKFIADRWTQGLERLKKLKTRKQIHCLFYGDIVEDLNKQNGTNYEWGALFKMLFRPTDELQNAIAKCRNVIGGDYICAVFRFQNLLGDFAEYQYSTLSNEERENLITTCKNALHTLQNNFSETQKILVTSDSVTFLNALADMQNIYAFPEKIVHIDNSAGETHNVYLKSFVDFFLLSEGKAIYSVGTKEMYTTTGFPVYAAKLNNVPFEKILI